MPTLTFVSLSLLTLLQGSQGMVNTTPLASHSELKKAFLNPKLWNGPPIIDWDKFYAKNPKAPMVYDPPQRYGKGSIGVSMPLIGEQYDTDLNYYFVDEARTLKPEEVAATSKPNAAKASEDLFEKVLRPHPDSSKVAGPFRNSLFWMEDNHMAEELVSFNSWAWRSQSEGNGRVIALGCTGYDWTNDASEKGALYTGWGFFNLISIQESPCKKWCKLIDVGRDGTPGTRWMTMYIIQEGDELVDRDGNPVPDVSPGDIMRVTYGDGGDPYECDPDKIVMKYLVRRVAKLNEETGEVERVPYHQSALMPKINAKLPLDMVDAKHLSVEEKFDLTRESFCDLQLYKPSPTPPSGDDIENL